MTTTQNAKTPAAATTEVKLTTTTDLGRRFNMKPTYLRRILRSMTTYNDGIHTKYGWDESTKEGKAAVQAIAQEIARRKGGDKTDKAIEQKAAKQAA